MRVAKNTSRPANVPAAPLAAGALRRGASPSVQKAPPFERSYTVMCADSQIWLSPWATVKANSTKHTVGSVDKGSAVTSS